MDSGNGNGHAETEEQHVRTVHVLKGLATAISTDGTTAMLKFEDASGHELAVTLPLAARRMIQAMLVDLENEAMRRKASKAAIPPRFPKTFQVAVHDGLRGMVLVLMDDNTPHEMMYAIPADTAWTLAEHIRDRVLTMKSPAERARLTAPPGRKLILPG
jgi:hypothetical protein